MSHTMDGCFIVPNNLSKIILTIRHDLVYFYLDYYVFLVVKQIPQLMRIYFPDYLLGVDNTVK